MRLQKTYILGGGTFSFVRNHLALSAPAFGETARKLKTLADEASTRPTGMANFLALTKMASPATTPYGTYSPTGNWLVTNDDVAKLTDQLIADPATKIIFFNVALCDFDGGIGDVASGKYADRLKTAEGNQQMTLSPADKVLRRIRKERKDIFLVAFKTTTGATEDEQYAAGLNLLKANSCNLVLANDTVTRTNMIIVPEEARYSVTTDRNAALTTLVDMANKRSQLTFTRSTVLAGESVSWTDAEVPASLRAVVDHCITAGAYKPFRGNTAGHFAVKVKPGVFLTSKRSTNFNKLNEIGLVKVESDGPDKVIAHGAKPSVGGQSQRIIFDEHPDVDCIVHFHSPKRLTSEVPVRPQQWLECGSHECGKNTSDGLEIVEPGIKAVYLDEHGPNVVFDRNIDPAKVISFIDRHFDLSQKTGGLVA